MCCSCFMVTMIMMIMVIHHNDHHDLHHNHHDHHYHHHHHVCTACFAIQNSAQWSSSQKKLSSFRGLTIEQSLAVSPKSRFKPNINSSISTLLSIQCWCSAVLGGGAGPAIWYDPSFTLHCLQKDKKDRNVCENIKKYKFLHLHSPLHTVLV